jgi:hypothetical protein
MKLYRKAHAIPKKKSSLATLAEAVPVQFKKSGFRMGLCVFAQDLSFRFTTLKDKIMFCSEVPVSVSLQVPEPQKVLGSRNKIRYCGSGVKSGTLNSNQDHVKMPAITF